MIKNMTSMRKLSKTEIRDYARTLVPILQSHELDGTKSMRIADAILTYAMKGLKPWYRRGSALQGFVSPAFDPLKVIEGYLVYPMPGLSPIIIQTPTFGNAYLFLDISGSGGGGGGGGSGIASTSAGYGQGGGGGADGGRLIVMTQGPFPSGTQLIASFGGNGGSGGAQTSTTTGNPGGAAQPGGIGQVFLGGGSITLSTPGGSAAAMPTPASGQAAGGAGGNGGSAEFIYLSTTSVLSAIQIPPRTTDVDPNNAVNNGIGGYGVTSEYFNPSNIRPIFVSDPIGAIVYGGGSTAGSVGGNGDSATVSVPSGMIPLRGSGGGGAGGSNYNTLGYAGGNGGPGGPGPIIVLVII